MVDKNAILNCLGDMCVKDIVMMILRGTFSFDEIKESGRLDDEKLELVALALSKAMEEKRHFEAELRRLEERAGKLLAAMKKLEGDHLTCPPLDFYESLVDARKSIIGDTHRLKEEIRYSEFCNDDELFPTVLVIESSLNSVGLVLPDLNCYCVLESGDHDDELFCLDPDDEKVLSPSIPRPEESKDLEDPMGLQKFPLPKTWRFWRRKAGSVYSALYAPAAAGVDKWFKVQVHLYGKSDAKRVNKKALAMDGNATLNESNPLSINIERGTKVEAEIHVYDDGVRVNTMKQSLVWNGEMVSTVFQVKANKSTLKSVAGDVTLSVKGFPVGRLSFNTEITQSPTDESTFVLGKAKSYKKAFISYSHVDIKSAEMAASFLKGLGLDYFFDRQSLAPGAVFNEEIKRNIRESDLFILLWSENAAKSEYVEKEYLYALPFAYPQEPREKATLEFLPYFIEPHADAPEKLKGIYNFSKMHIN